MAQSTKPTGFERSRAPWRLRIGLAAALALPLVTAPPGGAHADGAPAASLATRVEARAIFLPEATDFDVVRPIYAAGAAVVEDIRVGPDDVVTKDQVLMILRSPRIEDQIVTMRSSLQRRSDYFAQLTRLASQYDGAMRTLEDQRRAQIGEAIATIERERDGYQKILAGKSELREKGYETSGSAFQAQVQYDQSVNELMKQKLALLEIDSRLAQMAQQRFEQMAPLSRQIDDDRIALGELEARYEAQRTIRAPRDGIVNSIFVTRGSSIDAKDVLITLSNANRALQAYAFIDIADVPLVEPGMTVSLVPAHARKDLARPLTGTIRSISKTSLSRAEARNLFFDDDLVAYFIPGSVVYLAHVSLAADTPEGVVGAGDLATLTVAGRPARP